MTDNQSSSATPEAEAIWKKSWSWSLTRQGVPDMGLIKNELADYYALLQEVPKVYMHVTGQRVSKPNTLASVVISLADERLNEALTEHEAEVREECCKPAEPAPVPDELIIECAKAASDDASKLDEQHIATFLPTWRKFAEALTSAQAAPNQPVRGAHIKATIFHDAGAYAECGACGRYSDDPKTLSDRQPACDCGKQHYWSGSFKPPGPDAKWSNHNVAAAETKGEPA